MIDRRVYYAYDWVSQLQEVHEVPPDAWTCFAYDSGTLLAARKQGGGTLHQFPAFGGLKGNVAAAMDETGSVVARYQYDAWGNPLRTEDPGGGNRFTYQSNWIRLKDSGGELYLSPSRVYHAQVGRFLQFDPLPRVYRPAGKQGKLIGSRDPNSEAPKPKHTAITQAPSRNTKASTALSWAFGHSRSGFASHFGFRASDFQLSRGRGDRTRTCDLLNPIQARYQTAPRPECLSQSSPSQRRMQARSHAAQTLLHPRWREPGGGTAGRDRT